MVTPNEKNLFSRLFTYRPRENRLPEEDFFTEAFVGVMEREPDLLRELFKELTGNEVIDVMISSQVSYSSAGKRDRPDIQIIGKDKNEERHIILIESKLRSTEGPEQLNGYAKLLSEGGEASKTLVYITQFGDEVKEPCLTNDVKFTQKRWYEIYQFLKEKDNTGPFVKELLNFMEELNMTFDIKLSDLITGVSFARGQSKLWNLVYEAWDRGGLTKVTVKGAKCTSYPDRRIGLGTTIGKDSIAFYFGIWLDTSDKGPYDLTCDNSELPVLYLAIEKKPKESANNIYEKYRDSFDSLKEKKDWKLIDRSQGVIVRKSHRIDYLGGSDLDQDILKFFTYSFDEIRNAPFFILER